MEFRKPDISQMNANATHYCLLAALVNKTAGSILEFGVGHYSTPLLYFMSQKRDVLSIETNMDWFTYFDEKFGCKRHTFLYTGERLISDYFTELNINKHFDVAFIDHGPEPDRPKCVRLLKGKAKFIIVHDSEPDAAAYGWGNCFDDFKYKYYWDFYGNGTTIVSDEEEINFD